MTDEFKKAMEDKSKEIYGVVMPHFHEFTEYAYEWYKGKIAELEAENKKQLEIIHKKTCDNIKRSTKIIQLEALLENSPTVASRWREKYYDKIDELNAAEAKIEQLKDSRERLTVLENDALTKYHKAQLRIKELRTAISNELDKCGGTVPILKKALQVDNEIKEEK